MAEIGHPILARVQTGQRDPVAFREPIAEMAVARQPVEERAFDQRRRRRDRIRRGAAHDQRALDAREPGGLDHREIDSRAVDVLIRGMTAAVAPPPDISRQMQHDIASGHRPSCI